VKRTFNPDVFLSSKSFPHIFSAYVRRHAHAEFKMALVVLFFTVYIPLVHRHDFLFLVHDSNIEFVKGLRAWVQAWHLRTAQMVCSPVAKYTSGILHH